MNILKKLPIKYQGELHDVRLINFSVVMDEVRDKVPANIKIRDFNGRALVSMVDVKLKKMRPVFAPSLCHFNYRHIAFRLLVDDSRLNDGASKGIFFYQSFTNNALVVAGGAVLTDYNLSRASIREENGEVIISNRGKHVKYAVGNSTSDGPNDPHLQATIGALERAYSVMGDRIRVTEIQREKWPIRPVTCTAFENTFFESARFEGAFRVFETIYYHWLPPKMMER